MAVFVRYRALLWGYGGRIFNLKEKALPLVEGIARFWNTFHFFGKPFPFSESLTPFWNLIRFFGSDCNNKEAPSPAVRLATCLPNSSSLAVLA